MPNGSMTIASGIARWTTETSYVMVNPAKGSRGPLFDQEKLGGAESSTKGSQDSMRGICNFPISR